MHSRSTNVYISLLCKQCFPYRIAVNFYIKKRNIKNVMIAKFSTINFYLKFRFLFELYFHNCVTPRKQYQLLLCSPHPLKMSRLFHLFVQNMIWPEHCWITHAILHCVGKFLFCKVINYSWILCSIAFWLDNNDYTPPSCKLHTSSLAANTFSMLAGFWWILF